MTFSHIWQRYFLKEILKVFLLLLVCAFLSYVFVDYSVNIQGMLNRQISFADVFRYYVMSFFKRCDLLLSLSLLISSFKVLVTLNRRNELLPLQTAGIPLHALTRPFFLLGFACIGIGYMNFEGIFPKACAYIQNFENTFLKVQPGNLHPSAHSLPLEDGTHLFYQSYDPSNKEFSDVFWVLSTDEIYHMKTLSLKEHSLPHATFVDLIKRNQNNTLDKLCSYDQLSLKTLKIDFELNELLNTPINHHSITELIRFRLNPSPIFRENCAIVSANLYFKIVVPWAPILILLGIIPPCIKLTRTLPIFILFSLMLFGYICFFTIMNACLFLGEINTIPPSLAIFTLPTILFVFFGGNLLRTFKRLS